MRIFSLRSDVGFLCTVLNNWCDTKAQTINHQHFVTVALQLDTFKTITSQNKAVLLFLLLILYEFSIDEVNFSFFGLQRHAEYLRAGLMSISLFVTKAGKFLPQGAFIDFKLYGRSCQLATTHIHYHFNSNAVLS